MRRKAWSRRSNLPERSPKQSAGAYPRTRRESTMRGEGRNYSRKWKTRSKSSLESSGRPGRRLRPRLRPPRALTERERQMLQLQKGKLPTHRAESSPAQQRNHSSLLLPLTVTKSVTSREMSIPLSARDPKLESGRHLTKRNLLLRPHLRERSTQTLSSPTRVEQARICNRGRRFEIAHFSR